MARVKRGKSENMMIGCWVTIMKKIIEVLDVWRNAEKTLALSATEGTYSEGFHKGYIKALDKVKLLLEVQSLHKGNVPDPATPCDCYEPIISEKRFCTQCGRDM
jgi:hypothetical protein